MIIAKTTMRKMPAGCRKCPYYRPENCSVYGVEPGLCLLIVRTTDNIVVSRQRLPECPLMEVENV